MSIKSTSLCLFDEADIQMDIVKNIRVPYIPVNAITDGSPIEFDIPGSPDEYVDISDVRILLHLKILKKDKVKWDAKTDDVAFINQPISSIFQDVSFFRIFK